MKAICLSIASFFLFLSIAYSKPGNEYGNHIHYLSISRFTDPKNFAFMLDQVPADIMGICEIAEKQTVHHNLLIYHGIPYNKKPEMINVWPPRMNEILKAFKETEPYNLSKDRPIEQRYVGGCMNESHFLAGILRNIKIPARMRAGYFKDVFQNKEHFIKFWTSNFKGRNIMSNLLEENPKEWEKEVIASLNRQIDADKHFEHWICEYWDDNKKKWRMLDANTTFLKASFDIEVGYHLSEEIFEYAHEAWKKVREGKNFNPDQYREDEQDGPSHVRAQLLWDFYSLLNHDLTGYGEVNRDAFEFVKEKVFSEISVEELNELDVLAELLSKNPSKNELISFYQQSEKLKLKAVEMDPYSFAYRKHNKD